VRQRKRDVVILGMRGGRQAARKCRWKGGTECSMLPPGAGMPAAGVVPARRNAVEARGSSRL